MWRVLHLFAIAALIGSAIYVYNIKYETILESEEIVKLRHQIAKTNDDIAVMRAEYAHLARPDRVQELSDKLLQMQPLALNQIARPEDIPEKSAQGDALGRQLEQLGLGLSASPPNGAAGASPSTR
jgi:cell division protein FtsL